jgi:hypothetical protein
LVDEDGAFLFSRLTCSYASEVIPLLSYVLGRVTSVFALQHNAGFRENSTGGELEVDRNLAQSGGAATNSFTYAIRFPFLSPSIFTSSESASKPLHRRGPPATEGLPTTRRPFLQYTLLHGFSYDLSIFECFKFLASSLILNPVLFLHSVIAMLTYLLTCLEVVLRPVPMFGRV